MRETFVLICLLASVLSIRANDISNWIIENETIGSNILYRPNDYILDELNSANLVITGNIGDKVVSPVDGIVTSVSYGYMFDLQRTQSFKSQTTSLKNDLLFRKNVADEFNSNHNKDIDAKYVHYRISISTQEHGKFHLQGIINPSQFITGQKIKKGEVIGEIGYCYQKIEQPNLMISRSVNNKNADPMSIFGLKTTFKEPVIFIENDIYQPIEIKEDFKILRDAIIEGYPGLNDYISKDSLMTLCNNLELELNVPKTKQEFAQIIKRLIEPLRDGHVAIINTEESCHIKPKTEFYFGVQLDSMIVIRCLKDYKDFLGKKILSIDGIPFDTLISIIKPTIPLMADGYNTGRTDFEMLNLFWSYFDEYYHKKLGDSLVYAFSDGTIFQTTYKMHSINNYTRYSRPIRGNLPFTTMMIQDTIAYLDINTFGLFERTENEIIQFIDSIDNAKIGNLIIDVRNNPGGHEKSMAKLFAIFADSSFKTTIDQKVTSNKPYNFAKHSQNLIQGESVFPEYTNIKEGFYYLPDSLNTKYLPDSNLNYKGNVFILTNAFTFSAGSNFAALFKKYRKGVIIGQETRGGYCHINALKYANILLPNTNTEIRMPLVQMIFDGKENTINPWGRGVLPDLKIPLTIALFTDKEDKFLANAIQLVKDYDYTHEKVLPEQKSDNRLIIIFVFIGLIGIVLITRKLRHTTRAHK